LHHSTLGSTVIKKKRIQPLGHSWDVCKGVQLPVEGERCVISGWSLFKRLNSMKKKKKKLI
jgi:hypothetical protein